MRRKNIILGSNQKPSWIKYILRRIKNKKNFIGIFTGEPGSGKSECCLTVASMLDPTFHIGRVCFGFEDIIKLVRKGELKPGRVVIYEEAGIEGDSAKWYTAQNQGMGYLMQVCRDEQYVLLINTPYLDLFLKKGRKFIKGYFECLNIDFEKEVTRVKPMVLQYNEWMGKIYKKYLRVRIKGKGIERLTIWNVPKAPAELRKQYEDKKKAFKDELYIQIQQQLKPQKKKKYEQKCDQCGYSWFSTRERVGTCPACKRRMAYNVLKAPPKNSA